MAENDTNGPEEYLRVCRAVYDYGAQDGSALSFKTGDIIEVLSMQDSGWWDGLLRGERGWFPSNYVEVVPDDEAETLFSDSEVDSAAPSSLTHSNHGSEVDMGSAMMGSLQENVNWLNSELAGSSSNITSSTESTLDSASTQVHDFWIPEVTNDGQIFYVNTQTGQRSRDLPTEAGSETTEDLAGLTSQSSARSGPSAGLGYASDTSQSDNDLRNAGFGLPQRSGTPEPWVKKLADDGYSYFYLNQITQEIQWTRPVRNDVPSTNGAGTPIPSTNSHSRTKRSSVYSDTSDIQPFENGTIQKPRLNGHSHQAAPSSDPYAPTRSHQQTQSLPTPETTVAERIAQALQKQLQPPDLESITDLSAIARNAIQAIINNVHSPNRRPNDGERMDELIFGVVDSVRNLLYVSPAPTGQIPPHVIPREARQPKSSSSSASPLKPAQRKVTATLSRLVLSARAMQYDAGSVISDTLNRIEVDAEELERAIMAFVLEVQRLQHSTPTDATQRSLKRLHGTFSTTYVGLGLVGAGAAGTWTGFGFVPIDDSMLPQRHLGPEVVQELASYLQQLDGHFSTLGRYIGSNSETPVEQVRTHGQDLVMQISAFLAFVCNIQVADHVDPDGIHLERQIADDLRAQYAYTVDRTRLLIRTLEAAVQSLYDEGSSFFLIMQGLRELELGQSLRERDLAYDHIDALSTTIKSNMAVVQQTLDTLLSTGHEQSDLAHGEYDGAIQRRRDSRLSARPSSAILITDSLGYIPETSVDRAPRGQKAPAYYSDSQPSTSEPPSDSQDEEIDSEDEFDYPPAPKRSTKQKNLERFFGDKTQNMPAPPSPPPQIDVIPWFLKADYDPKEILVDGDFSVRGGTVPALVARLTAHEHQDSNYLLFQRAFLMTFKSFTTVDEFFDLLVARFWIEPPPGLSSQELESWTKQKQRVIQARVLNTLKALIIDDDVLDKEDQQIYNRIKQFVQQEEVFPLTGAKTLLPLLDRAQRGIATKVTHISVGTAPSPVMPKAGKKLKLLDIDATEMARQLTVMESRLYQKIRPMECLSRAREQKTENVDNIALVIQTSNRIADWVAESILTKEDSRRRAAQMKHLITIADRCRTMNNFSTMIAITSGLNTPPIRRLKRTWEQVNQRVMVQFTACEMTIDSSKNFHKYRQLMATVNPPCVPFIGVFLSTLQFIHDGNPDTLPGDLVNFKKRQKASEVISDIQRWQQQSFNFQPIPSIQAYIEESLSQFQDTKASSEHFWTLSLEREPREREDEKMARLLQESGFL